MKPFSMAGIWVTGVLGAGCFGGLTNALNARVSPQYYRTILGWDEVEAITRAIIAQGIFEGLILGLVLSTVFSAVIGIVTSGACPFTVGARYVGLLLLSASVTWLAGGLLATGLAALSPEFYSQAIIGVPEEAGARLRFAWVGGSIVGAQLGGIAAVILMSVLFRASWRGLKSLRREEASEADAPTA